MPLCRKSKGEIDSMAMRNSTLVGVFDERGQAEAVIEQLHNAGIPDEQIRYSGASTGTGGGFLAGIKSLFTGEDPDASGDNLANDLANMGLSQDEVNYYRNEHQAGHFIVAVNPGDRWQDVQIIMNSAGAYNYSSRSAGRTGTYAQPGDYAQTQAPDYTTQNYANQTTAGTSFPQTQAPDYNQATDQGFPQTQAPDYNQTASNYGQGTDMAGTAYDNTRAGSYADTDDEGRRMKFREEQLNVDKQPVESGEARLRKDVVEEQQNIDVPVNREEVVVNRQSYGEDRPTDVPVGQDETMRVPVREEQVDTSKQTVETGEVAPGKRTVQDQQRVSDTVRREEARLDRDGNATIRESNADQGTYNNPNTDQDNP